MSCLHPVRFYQPPDRPSFACVYARPLPADAPVALYAGVVRKGDRERAHAASDAGMYSWELDSDADSNCIINAGKRGGVARFINADTFRTGGADIVNCEAHYALDEDLLMPTVALHTTCAVAGLKECICNYGVHYWPLMKQRMVDEWDEYLSMARFMQSVTAEYLVACGVSPLRLPVPLPAHHDESYHWAPDEVVYPVWPVTPAAAAAPRTFHTPMARKHSRFISPVKRTTQPGSNVKQS